MVRHLHGVSAQDATHSVENAFYTEHILEWYDTCMGCQRKTLHVL